MRSLTIAVLATLSLTMASAIAQTPPPATAPVAPAPATAAPPSQAPAAPAMTDGGKRVACRQAVQAKGLRGQDGRDQMQLCMAQGQLDCVQQAIAQKTAGPQRKDFMSACMGRKAGGDRS